MTPTARAAVCSRPFSKPSIWSRSPGPDRLRRRSGGRRAPTSRRRTARRSACPGSRWCRSAGPSSRPAARVLGRARSRRRRPAAWARRTSTGRGGPRLRSGSVRASSIRTSARAANVDHVLTPLITQSRAVRGGRHGDAGHVGAVVGLGHRHRHHDLAGGHLRQPAPLLLLGAAAQQRPGQDLRPGDERPAGAERGPGQLLGGDHHARGSRARRQSRTRRTPRGPTARSAPSSPEPGDDLLGDVGVVPVDALGDRRDAAPRRSAGRCPRTSSKSASRWRGPASPARPASHSGSRWAADERRRPVEGVRRRRPTRSRPSSRVASVPDGVGRRRRRPGRPRRRPWRRSPRPPGAVSTAAAAVGQVVGDRPGGRRRRPRPAERPGGGRRASTTDRARATAAAAAARSGSRHGGHRRMASMHGGPARSSSGVGPPGHHRHQRGQQHRFVARVNLGQRLEVLGDRPRPGPRRSLGPGVDQLQAGFAASAGSSAPTSGCRASGIERGRPSMRPAAVIGSWATTQPPGRTAAPIRRSTTTGDRGRGAARSGRTPGRAARAGSAPRRPGSGRSPGPGRPRRPPPPPRRGGPDRSRRRRPARPDRRSGPAPRSRHRLRRRRRRTSIPRAARAGRGR